MSDRPRSVGIVVYLRIGFRNITRNGRRSGLTMAGIAFSVLLIGIAASLQDGSYATQRQIATDLLTGHLQVTHPLWPDESSVDQLVEQVHAVSGRILQVPGVQNVMPRLQMSALVSFGERTAAGAVFGMDLAQEATVTGLLKRLKHGQLPKNDSEMVIGSTLARHLGVVPGDEVVLLGSGPQGSVAALSLSVSGILDSGITELDRGLVITGITALAEAMMLEDAAHLLVVRGDGPLDALRLADEIKAAAGHGLLVRTWQQVLPEVEQAIELDRTGGYIFFGLLLFLVAFSVANTFVMIVFERTREIGMLRSLGMRPWTIIGLFQIEAIALWVLGVLAGLTIAIPVMLWLKWEGLYMGEALESTMSQMYMPSRIHGELSARSLCTAPLFLLVATQLAALLPGLRARHILPAEAMRRGA